MNILSEEVCEFHTLERGLSCPVVGIVDLFLFYNDRWCRGGDGQLDGPAGLDELQGQDDIVDGDVVAGKALAQHIPDHGFVFVFLIFSSSWFCVGKGKFWYRDS